MLREDVGSVPVLEDGRLAGMLTDRDIVLRVVAEGRDARTITVRARSRRGSSRRSTRSSRSRRRAA